LLKPVISRLKSSFELWRQFNP